MERGRIGRAIEMELWVKEWMGGREVRRVSMILSFSFCFTLIIVHSGSTLIGDFSSYVCGSKFFFFSYFLSLHHNAQ